MINEILDLISPCLSQGVFCRKIVQKSQEMEYIEE